MDPLTVALELPAAIQTVGFVFSEAIALYVGYGVLTERLCPTFCPNLYPT